MKPWLTDPLYGGMSEESARRSYDAWFAQGCKPTPVLKPAADDEEIALRKIQIDTMLLEYKAEVIAAVRWFREWKSRLPKGFRSQRQKMVARA